MSNYLYKGVPISTITNNSGSSAPGYDYFPIQLTNYTQNRPLEFGFYSNGLSPTNVSDSATARADIYKSSTTVNDFQGAKSIRILSIGGGGGGGGWAGSASAKQDPGINGNSKSGSGSGGNGGNGGYGTYGGTNTTPIYGSSIEIFVGTGGLAGDTSANSANSTKTGNAKANTQPGKTGDPGNYSYIVMGGLTYGTAAAGNGGNGGNGGTASANIFNQKSNGTPGSPGSSGTLETAAQVPDYWNPDNISNYGIGGTGGQNNANQPTNGTDGFVQIIWLYD